MTVSPDKPDAAATRAAVGAAPVSAVDGADGAPAAPASGHLPVSADHSALPPTERRNPRTTDIDVLPTVDVLRLMNDEDGLVPGAVRSVLGALADVVDAAADRVRRGGRVHYYGAGSSGRIAVLDASELAPTFGLRPGVVIPHLAGGPGAMTRAVEGAEDDEARGAEEAGADLGELDVVIGLSASGRTPYVAGALAEARARGAYTAVITSDPGSRLLPLADVGLVPETGPEAIAGSTRLKATTAMKLILNSFSSALMIRLGKTYSNLMVEVSASNSKLRGRKVRILGEATGEPGAACESSLAEAEGDLRVAMVMLLGGASAAAAREALSAAAKADNGGVRAALDRLLHFRKEVPRS
ncbi:MAG: N-acetylmuramic acid 6-phosphate etherase [Nocardiopsaceae bacterium]|nr:N-acetylmuramic acid 6-phosphate etherase [Nocardiopsaceae bacterium]